jgi:Ca2+-binding RTX toxin-like protein
VDARKLLIVALAAPLVLATRASAATVTAHEDDFNGLEVVYVAATGEGNDVVVVDDVRNRVMITDRGAPVTASGACTSVDAHSAVCPGVAGRRPADAVDANLTLGDRDDRFATPRRFDTDDVNLHVDGGPGNDVLSGGGNDSTVLHGGEGNDLLHANDWGGELHGGPGDDVLYGGDDMDQLYGGGGHDQLYGRGGHDDLTDGDRDGGGGAAAPGSDTLDGGGGTDGLSYEHRTRRLSVRAEDNDDAGESGEHDSVRNVEWIFGGAGDDRLVGDRGRNRLAGGRGNDTLVGRGGDDEFFGEAGDDRLIGGAGRDVFIPGAGTNMLVCGGGRDSVEPWRFPSTQLSDTVPASCETVRFALSDISELQSRVRPLSTRAWMLSLRLACPTYTDGGCRGTIRLHSRGRRRGLLAVGRFRHGHDGHSFAAPLALTTLGYRWWTGRLGRATATISLRMIAQDTTRRPFRWPIRAPRGP